MHIVHHNPGKNRNDVAQISRSKTTYEKENLRIKGFQP